jgi:hypothetical protein
MGIGRLMSMVLAGIRVGGIGWELNRRSQSTGMGTVIPDLVSRTLWDLSRSSLLIVWRLDTGALMS